jgi:transcriptional regulator with XRE-family HTH domain
MLMSVSAGAGGATAGKSKEARRKEFAAFLRSRRERISPHEVGIRATDRRRTPGLRREEVAELAAVGVTWYTWLEQGRPVRASAQVLQAIADALLLGPSERAYLFTLAEVAQPSGRRPGTSRRSCPRCSASWTRSRPRCRTHAGTCWPSIAASTGWSAWGRCPGPSGTR